MRKVLFLTGTRADFGKLKPLMQIVEREPDLECNIFITGMHTLSLYGNTQNEVYKSGFTKCFVYHNQHYGEPMETILANTIEGLSRYVHEQRPDLLLVHGDRVEALAGAIVGAMNNVLVAHVEGGERSGTIDELLRHSISKLSHIHFAANQEARQRLVQMGESESNIYVIGSPDIDIMHGESLPSLQEVKWYYDIPYDKYSIIMLHPVTTELEHLSDDVDSLIDALEESRYNYVIIYPNNDAGAEIILSKYKSRLENNKNIKIFPSLRFEYFLALLKNADMLIGNSSAGIREAPEYGVPTINIGTRQSDRYQCDSIINVPFKKERILEAINVASVLEQGQEGSYFGNGESARLFSEALRSERFWKTKCQKSFQDIDLAKDKN